MPQNKSCSLSLQKTIKVGKLDTGDGEDGEGESGDNFKKYLPVEFLKRIPGIDQEEMTAITTEGKDHGIKTIVDLCKAKEDTLFKIMPPKNAKEIMQFLSKPVEFDFANK